MVVVVIIVAKRRKKKWHTQTKTTIEINMEKVSRGVVTVEIGLQIDLDHIAKDKLWQIL